MRRRRALLAEAGPSSKATFLGSSSGSRTRDGELPPRDAIRQREFKAWRAPSRYAVGLPSDRQARCRGRGSQHCWGAWGAIAGEFRCSGDAAHECRAGVGDAAAGALWIICCRSVDALEWACALPLNSRIPRVEALDAISLAGALCRLDTAPLLPDVAGRNN